MANEKYLIEGHYYQYDLQWLIEKILEFESSIKEIIDLQTIHYADPIQWNITTQYAPNTVVVDENTGIAYMSKRAVPSGILLSNTDYWVVIFNYQKIYDKIMSGVAFNDKDNLTASKDLLVNDLVWYQGDLYRATRAIPEGSRYVVGTNITPTTIENLLSAYYGRDRTAQVMNDTVNVSGDYTLNAGDIAETSTNRTEKVTADREIDIDGSDSVHIDGASTVNIGGMRTEVYAANRDIRNSGAYTEVFDLPFNKTAPGKSKITAGNRVFELDKIQTTVKDYGAIGDGNTDDTAAFNKMLDDVGYLVIPKGDYLLTETLSINHGTVIIGAGVNNTNLVFTGDINGIVITLPKEESYYDSFTIRDITIAKKTGSTGIGLTVDGTATINDRVTNDPIIENVSIASYTYDDTVNGWLTCLKLINCNGLTITGCSLTGISDAARATYKSTGILVEAGAVRNTEFMISNTKFTYCAKCITGTVFEGIMLNNCVLIGSNIGVYWHATEKVPHLAISNTHFSCTDAAVDIDNIAQITISNNLIYNFTGGQQIGTLQILNNCETAVIANNVIVDPWNENNVGIFFDADTGIITGNIFNTLETGIIIGANAKLARVYGNSSKGSTNLVQVRDGGTAISDQIPPISVTLTSGEAYGTSGLSYLANGIYCRIGVNFTAAVSDRTVIATLPIPADVSPLGNYATASGCVFNVSQKGSVSVSSAPQGAHVIEFYTQYQ